MNIAALLKAVVEPDRPALILPDRAATSFRELDELASRLAGGLRQAGLQPGQRVIVLAPISLDLYAGLIALFKLGLPAVFLDPQAGFRQLERAAALSGAVAFLGSRKALWLKWLSPTLRRIPQTLVVGGDGPLTLSRLARDSAPYESIVDVDPETPALITFTGGSTDPGGPRGVLRTHRLLASQHAALAGALPAQPGDIDMPAFPVATLHNLASGITSVIPDFPFRRPQAVQTEKVLRQMLEFGVTSASGSPAYWWTIASHCLAHGLRLPLRRIVTGGAPVAPGLVERLHKAAPQAEILAVYGSTEAEPVAVMPGTAILAETAALTAAGAGIPLGTPVAQVTVRILGPDGRERATDEVGEIWVAGEHVARGYFANPQAEATNKQADAGGRIWHAMGDLGSMDARGRLWLAGRVHTAIVRAGRTIYPVPVEAAVDMLPYVRRAALTGHPDSRLGESTCLTVELAQEVSPPAGWPAQIQALCAEHGWAIDRVRSIRHMPLDARHNARIDYRRLK